MHLLASLLDHETPPWRADVVPPLGHWLLFPPAARQSRLGPDGHPLRTGEGVLPLAEDLPRRMWAGSRIRFLADIPLDSLVRRETTLAAATSKIGRSGKMLFARLLHRLSVDGQPTIEEEQDIVYREAPPPGALGPASEPGTPTAPPQAVCMARADPVRLFRYSALTFNAHRIHYDRDYATQVEGYPALVVHGPFIATLLMDYYLRHRRAAQVTGFAFRAVRPLFDTDCITLGLTERDQGADLCAINSEGDTAMTAEVTVA